MIQHVNSYDADAPTPEVGSWWDWYSGKTARPLLADDDWKPEPAYERVKVVEVKWNGEEWWVRTDGPRFGLKWNDLGLFWENIKDVTA